jgi:hypothetical protein
VNNRPNASELLAIARATFTAEILPALPEELRYNALMIANALAIARREIEAGDTPLRAEFERLTTLLSEIPREVAGEALPAALADYNRRLASQIRAGRFDREERAVLLEHLRKTTEEKLAVSNPKALSGK